MRIGIDACTWANRRGYGRFTRGLVTAMVNEFPQHEFVLVVDRHTAQAAHFPSGASVQVVDTSAQPTEAASADGSRTMADLARMGRAAARIGADVFLFPSNYSFFPLWSRTPAVTVFHDATAENHPELIFPQVMRRTLWRIKSLIARRQSDRLVTVSADAQQQIARVFGYAVSDIEVVGEGTDPVFHPRADSNDHRVALDQVRRRYALPDDRALVLYVGGISPHKNLAGLLRAHAMANRAAVPRHLVLVGDIENDSFLGNHHELVALASQLGVSQDVTFTGFVPDDALALLYNAATLFVLPSFSEGFGLPVLEAMASGLPVAVSNRYSLPEVVGDAGVTFDPSSDAAIAGVMDRLLSDAAQRAAMRERGLVRAAAYSWTTAAADMVRILNDVAERPGRRTRGSA